ncbi:MAG: YHS domain-containing (seleno)protein [Deltaproteobacteria bacterium]|jgi:hypothetical protein
MKLDPLRLGFFLVLLLGLVAAAAAQPPATTSGGSGMALLNLDNSVALHGYDPVAYFTRNRAVKGKKWIIERLGGAEYRFASRRDRYEFLRDAPRYQPQFGGYCATSLAMGRLQDIDPEIFVIYDGKLYLFNNTETQAVFLRNPRRIISEAREHYFKIAAKRRSRY